MSRSKTPPRKKHKPLNRIKFCIELWLCANWNLKSFHNDSSKTVGSGLGGDIWINSVVLYQQFCLLFPGGNLQLVQLDQSDTYKSNVDQHQTLLCKEIFLQCWTGSENSEHPPGNVNSDETGERDLERRSRSVERSWSDSYAFHLVWDWICKLILLHWFFHRHLIKLSIKTQEKVEQSTFTELSGEFDSSNLSQDTNPVWESESFFFLPRTFLIFLNGIKLFMTFTISLHCTLEEINLKHLLILTKRLQIYDVFKSISPNPGIWSFFYSSPLCIYTSPLEPRSFFQPEGVYS